MSKLEHAQKLIKHARAITGDVNKYAILLEKDDVDQATKKLTYGRAVLQALGKFISDPGPLDDPAMRDVVMDILVSVRPSLEVALNSLAKTLESGEYFKVPEFRVPEELDEEAILRALEQSIDWEAIRAAAQSSPSV